MNENQNEQTKAINSQATEVEENLGEREAEVSLGKFKSTKALLEAYNSLEAEFTKRCQKIKEYEAKLEVAEKAKASAETQNLASEKFDKEEVLKDYLKGLIGGKAEAVILNGVGAGLKTPVSRPKTISEAGRLAKELLSK